jgi:integrase
MKRTLNDRLIRALKPAAAGCRYEVKDIVVPGLAVRVTDNGRRTYILRRRYPGSTHANRRALGDCGVISLDDARTKARAWLEMIARDVDPRTQEERQRQAERGKRRNTFAAIAEDFIRDKLPGERKGWEAERDIRREFLPVWGKRPIAEITARDVRDIIKAVKDRGTLYQAHNLFVLARRLFSWTIDQHVYGLETSPCDRLKPKALVGKRSARTRVLTGDELGALWKAAESLGYPYGPLFRMLALTGQRKSEVAEARWSEFDLGHKLWTIPAERMKADAAHVVPLTDDVIEILTSLPRFNKGDHLFSTDSGVKPVDGFSNGKVKLDKAMAAELGRAVEPFVIHDIRRTMRTGLSALPVPDLVRELVIAHSKPGLHKVYDQHAYLDEKRRALELWAAKLRSIVEPPPANVVALREAAL